MRVARRAGMGQLVLFVAAAHAAAAPILVSVAPDAGGAEGFAVADSEGAAIDLAGWSVSDGEGAWTFPGSAALAAGATMWVVDDVAAWSARGGKTPTYAWQASAVDGADSASVPVHPAGGRLALANDGDDLMLRRPDGSVADRFDYGSSVGLPPRPNLVFERRVAEGDWSMGGGADDWRTPRLHKMGESDLPAPSFPVAAVNLYASPDSSFQTLGDLVSSASRRLHLHVYELTSPALADALVAAKQQHPALDLAVLVEDAPVGLQLEARNAQADALQRILDAGGRVVMGGSGRYDHHHLKVLVADDAVAVQSENWVPSGVPEDSSWGNRGWGVVVRDAAAAQWFSDWMAADRAAWDSKPFVRQEFAPLFEPPARSAPRRGDYAPTPAATVEGALSVQPVIAPDHTHDPAADPIAAAIRQARRVVRVQQLDLSLHGRNDLGWTGDDPLVAALVDAARQGVTVRVLAAAPFSADDTGNQQAVDHLNDFARRDGLDLEARVFLRPGLATLHNKGVLVDDDLVVVGSLNGNLHSRAQNREASLIVRGLGAALPFASLFDADWDARGPPRDAEVILRDLRGIPAAPLPTLFAMLLVAGIAVRARARGGPP